MSGLTMPVHYVQSEGGVFETDLNTGHVVVKKPSVVTYDSDWPPAARQRVAFLEEQISELRQALALAQKGDGHG